MEEKVETLETQSKDRDKIEKKIIKIEKKIDKILGKKFLKELGKQLRKGQVNEQAYSLILEDIDWLLNDI